MDFEKVLDWRIRSLRTKWHSPFITMSILHPMHFMYRKSTSDSHAYSMTAKSRTLKEALTVLAQANMPSSWSAMTQNPRRWR